VTARKFQQVPGAYGTGVQGLDRVLQVILGASRRGQMEYNVQLVIHHHGNSDVLLDELKARVLPRSLMFSGEPVRKLSKPTTW